MRLQVAVTGIDQVRDRMRRLATALPAALDLTALDVERGIDQAAGQHRRYSRTGNLVRSVFKRRVPGGWEVGHDAQIAPHAVFVIKGTRPHIILPRNKKVLRWPVPGGFRYAKRVKHPGTRADDYIRRLAAEVPRIFDQHLRAQVARANSRK